MKSLAILKDRGFPRAKSRGFAIVEVLITLAITVLLLALILPIYGNLFPKESLREVARTFSEQLNMAKMRSQVALNGVHYSLTLNINPVGSDSYTINPGSQTTNLDSNIFLSTNLSSNIINFKFGAGEPSVLGQIIFSNQAGETATVTIAKFGRIFKE
ncbi:MAG: hypothetical protein AAB453_01845 [Patescibacteria group bacterium]